MKYGLYIIFALFTVLLLHSCKKNTLSKIPYISLISFTPDSIKVTVDTPFIVFNFTDGNGDIGNDSGSAIYVHDSRDAAGVYTQYPFPYIKPEIETNKGLQGTCVFYPSPPLHPRLDSLHMKTGDTLFLEFYITDRAGDSSNHLTTHSLIIRP